MGWIGAVRRTSTATASCSSSDPPGGRPDHAGHAGAGGLPHVVSRPWWRRAGGGAVHRRRVAATISNALVRDLYFRRGPAPRPSKRVILSKFALLAVALAAGDGAAEEPRTSAAGHGPFSLAASALFRRHGAGHLLARHHARAGGGGRHAVQPGVAVYMLSRGRCAGPAAPPGCWPTAWFVLSPSPPGCSGVPAVLLAAQRW